MSHCASLHAVRSPEPFIVFVLITSHVPKRLVERIKGAGLPAPATDDERLLKEIVFFADRSDISEELTRLQSHFKQFDDCVKSGEPVGRMLDFLGGSVSVESAVGKGSTFVVDLPRRPRR